ncbi:TPA: tape measure protein [Escherichia coli]|nr:tape measure protein [Escherichia coli]HBN7237008.1 tape measure protein [Escherichia coli]
MSENVEFILSLEDKQFTATIDRAGKMLTRFGEQATKPVKKIQSFERSLSSVARIIGVLESKLDSTADKLQDVAAGFELASDTARKMRGDITSLNSGLKALIERVNTTTSSVDKLTSSLRKAQSELKDFSDWATFASKSASRFGSEVKDASASVSGMNMRLNTTTKRLSNWGVTTSQAAEGLKKVREQMDEVIQRQQLISKPVRVRTSGGGNSSGGGGSSGGARSSLHSNKNNDGGMFAGLRGNIFLLGEIGDAARTVTSIMFGWQRPIVEAAAEMERMRVLLRGLNRDAANPAKAADSDMKYIVDMAKNAPFEMQALTDSFVKFRSAGLDPTDGSLKTLVDSVARFGGDSELLKRASIAIQQMSGKGVISMEELRQQLGEAIPSAMGAMAKAAGMTMGELTKAITTGTVEAKSAIALMFKELNRQNSGAAAEMMKTYTGALAQLKTSFTLFADRVGNAGYLDSLTKAMKELSAIMNSADGASFAHGLGSGLSTVIDGLRELAKWAVKNQELLSNLAKIAATMIAFKVMRAGIMGVISAGGQMISLFSNMATAIQSPFILGSTAVTRFNRAARMGLGVIPSLIFAIRGAFSGLTAFLAANPIGATFTLAITAVASLITYMQLLKTKVEDVVNKVREIPEAMTAADRAILDAEIKKKKQQIEAAEQESVTGKRTLFFQGHIPYEVGVDKEQAKTNKAKLQKELADLESVLSKGVEKTVEKGVSQALENALDTVNKKTNEHVAKTSRQLEELNKKSYEIDSRNDLSDYEKEKLRSENSRKIGQIYREIDEEKLKSLVNINDKLIADLATLNDTLNSAQQSGDLKLIEETKAKINATGNALNSLKQHIDGARASLGVIAGEGVNSVSGGKIGSFSGEPANPNSKTMTGFWKQQMDSKMYQRVNIDGTPLMDLQGKPVVGPRQLKEQLRQKKIYGDVKLEQLSEKDRIAVIQTLTKARELDAEVAEKAAMRTANAAKRAADKELASKQKLAAGYQKALDKADQLMGQMGESSKATVSFDQSLRDTTKSLTELANATPNELISQEMIDKAKKRLKDLANVSDEYREMFDRRNVEQMISTWAPESQPIISAGYKPSRAEKVAEFDSTYKRNLENLIKLRQTAIESGEASSSQIELYTQRINQMIAAGNTALIKETGTATQQLALEYEDLASQVESTWANLFSGLSDVLTDFVDTGKMDFSSLAKSILKDITSMMVKSQIVLPLMNMLGMGTTNAGVAQSGNQYNGLLSGIINQGVTLGHPQSGSAYNGLISGVLSQGIRLGNVSNGEKTVGDATKETSNYVAGLGVSTQQTSSAIGIATNAISGWTSGLNSSTYARMEETKAVNSSIFSMQNLGAVAGALSTTFAMMGASSGSKTSKWLNFGATVASGLVSAWAGGSFDGLLSSGSSSGFNNLTGIAMDGTRGIPAIPKFAKGGIFGKDGVIPLRQYQRGGIANSPQLALFGEGSMNEAYVPLPDGRSIPVTLNTEGVSGASSVISPVNISITVNGDGSGETSLNRENQWSEAAQRMKAIALETIAQEKRPGGSLNPHSQRN